MRQWVYLHGMPGGPNELELFGQPDWPNDVRLFAPDRNGKIRSLSDQVNERFPQGKVTLIGFSLGAKVALELAAELGGRVEMLHLVSAAAPIQTPDTLKLMAGGALFGMARNRPGLFAVVVRVQAWMSRWLPGSMVRLLFASAQGGDAQLRGDPDFRRGIAGILRRGLGHSTIGYQREIIDYVRDWRPVISQVAAPATIWHGDLDNWSPPVFADLIAADLAGPVTIRNLPGLSHYSTLAAMLAMLQNSSCAMQTPNPFSEQMS